MTFAISHMTDLLPLKMYSHNLTLLHSERPKLYGVLAFLSAVGLNRVTSFSICFSVITKVSFFFFTFFCRIQSATITACRYNIRNKTVCLGWGKGL